MESNATMDRHVIPTHVYRYINVYPYWTAISALYYLRQWQPFKVQTKLYSCSL